MSGAIRRSEPPKAPLAKRLRNERMRQAALRVRGACGRRRYSRGCGSGGRDDLETPVRPEAMLFVPETVLVQLDAPMRWLSNASNPGIGLTWTQQGFNDAGSPRCNAGPSLPPRSMPATVSSRRPFFCLSAPWQA